MIETELQEIALVPNDTYNYSNSNVFYSLVNFAYLTYYQNVIRPSQQWLDGFVPTFHKAEKGIMSSRIGAKLTKGVTNQIFGRGIVFVNGKKTTSHKGLDFISHDWQDKCNFQNCVKQLIGYTVPLGTALMKLNKSADGELWIEPVRADYFYFSTNSRGDLEKVTTYVRTFNSTEHKGYNYILVEERYFKTEYEKFTETLNGKVVEYEDKTKPVKRPYAVYKVYKASDTSNNNSLAAHKGNGENFKNLPKEVQTSINEAYSTIILNKEIALPFCNYLGCELFKNEGGDFTHPSTPFGSPMMFDLISSFMEYDMEISYSVRDLFNSKGIVGVPKNLTQSQITGVQTGLTPETPFGKLNISGYELVNGLDPQTQKPIVTQFEMRAAEHETKQNALLKTMATSIGMSPRVIASYLVNGNEKTAEQTHSEDDTVAQWTKTHRQDYIFGLNRIIETVLSFYGIIDNVEVKFASDGLVSTERQLEIIKTELEMGVIDIEDAVRELNPDLDEEQLAVKIAKAKENKALMEQQQAQQFDESFGDDLDFNNPE